MANPILNARLYARISGLALAATALLGIVLSLINDGGFIAGFLEFDWTHNIVHVVLAAIALYVGFGASDAMTWTYAKVFGIVYFALGVVGFVTPVVDVLDDLLALHLELGENLVHLAIGAWGIVAGFFGASAAPKPAVQPRRA